MVSRSRSRKEFDDPGVNEEEEKQGTLVSLATPYRKDGRGGEKERREETCWYSAFVFKPKQPLSWMFIRSPQ